MSDELERVPPSSPALARLLEVICGRRLFWHSDTLAALDEIDAVLDTSDPLESADLRRTIGGLAAARTKHASANALHKTVVGAALAGILAAWRVLPPGGATTLVVSLLVLVAVLEGSSRSRYEGSVASSGCWRTVCEGRQPLSWWPDEGPTAVRERFEPSPLVVSTD